jgi:hypothetical protein
MSHGLSHRVSVGGAPELDRWPAFLTQSLSKKLLYLASKKDSTMTHASDQNSGCLAACFRLLRNNSPEARNIPDFKREPQADTSFRGTAPEAWNSPASSNPSQPDVDGSDSSPVLSFPYGMRDHFLSATELAFYHVLRKVVPRDVIVNMKVRLADVFYVAGPYENRAAFNRIAQKHIDFLLCEPTTLRPLLGIELDDSSHTRLDRQERDTFVDQAFAAAHLPLIHIQAQRAYSSEYIAAQLAPFVDQIIMTHSTPLRASEESTPRCTNCGIPMIVRRASRGPQQGKRFYGCTNYPQCRVMQPLD